MTTAKDIILKPIPKKEADALIKKVHYSGKIVQNSQIHIGVFLRGKLEGAMQFGPSLDKRKIQPLVEGTGWNEFIELNRMAFTDALPRNSESRAIAIAMRILKKHAPHLKWVISFADGCQCGDGTIYRASGFVLTAIKENKQIYQMPFTKDIDPRPLLAAGLSDDDIRAVFAWLDSKTGTDSSGNITPPTIHKLTLQDRASNSAKNLIGKVKQIMRKLSHGKTSTSAFFNLVGGKPITGYQLRYIYFLDPTYRSRLVVSEIPFSQIKEKGASMYLGRAGSH